MLRNDIGEDGAKAILDVAQGKSQLTTLCGIKSDQTEADFSYNGLKVEDAILLAFDLKKNSVLVSLKCVLAFSQLSAATDIPCTLVYSLRGNSLGTEGWCAVFAALRDNKDNKIESWDLSGQSINPEIAKVLAEYISVSTAVRSLKCAATAPSNL